MRFRRKMGGDTYNQDPRGELEGNLSLDEVALKHLVYRMNALETMHIKDLEELGEFIKAQRVRISSLSNEVEALRRAIECQ